MIFFLNFLNTLQAIYLKTTANIILSGRTLKSISGIKQVFPFSPLQFIVVLKELFTPIRQENYIKNNQRVRKALKFSLFADNIILN